MEGRARSLIVEILGSIVAFVVLPLGSVIVAGYWINRYRTRSKSKNKESGTCVESKGVATMDTTKVKMLVVLATAAPVVAAVVARDKADRILHRRRRRWKVPRGPNRHRRMFNSREA